MKPIIPALIYFPQSNQTEFDSLAEMNKFKFV